MEEILMNKNVEVQHQEILYIIKKKVKEVSSSDQTTSTIRGKFNEYDFKDLADRKAKSARVDHTDFNSDIEEIIDNQMEVIADVDNDNNNPVDDNDNSNQIDIGMPSNRSTIRARDRTNYMKPRKGGSMWPTTMAEAKRRTE